MDDEKIIKHFKILIDVLIKIFNYMSKPFLDFFNILYNYINEKILINYGYLYIAIGYMIGALGFFINLFINYNLLLTLLNLLMFFHSCIAAKFYRIREPRQRYFLLSWKFNKIIAIMYAILFILCIPLLIMSI